MKRKSIIPGFGISFGLTITILSLVVLIPLCSLVVYAAKLSPSEFLYTVTRPRVLSGYYVSISTAFVASIVNAVMGLILAWVLVRYEFPGKRFLDGIIELPFALPTAVAGISLTHMTTTNGWIGKIFYDAFGIRIAYTRLGITIALIFIGIPFVVRSVQPVLEKIDIQCEEAAFMLGADRKTCFRKVIFPEILPALISGFTLAFARCIGEYGSVVFIAGNTPYETEIAPLLIMAQLQEFDYSAATSIALVMLLIAFVILSINALLQSSVAKRVNGKS
ncbi:MAG: sulfate ABC transporter permease subunit CysT [Lachnospiraceae bacterium]|nr:sulfate ABC transporter permease subunit CysT [Lachnospiraceae bacterium]MBR3516139.1 sulfate ABC transporter permease subunit CysT [Lachnospiraceae bacterium]MBR3734854.1 sulfate ABC transporter permease subunit CysT [Lachnospiraceae bacterium]MBR6156899.1 sulfate ABC transporter permease subunit CysT [Lachnospiraceae bacterium]